MKPNLIVFIRKPELGRVKTRLAASIGQSNALQVYKQLLAHTHALCRAFEGKVWVFYAGDMLKDDAWGAPFECVAQHGHDLGERMQNAFRHVFASNPQPSLIIGSDCPGLQQHHLTQAVSHLQTYDAVIGPALDGGYYLLGLQHFVPVVFEELAWSTASVFEQTKAKLNAAHKSHFVLEALRDIDEIEDLKPWLKSLHLNERILVP